MRVSIVNPVLFPTSLYGALLPLLYKSFLLDIGKLESGL